MSAAIAPSACAAALVSQLNSQAVLGMGPDRYLDWIKTAGVPVIKLGKLRLVEIGAALAALRALAVEPPAPRPVVDELAAIRELAGLRKAAPRG
jgi:hypothetical protein